MAKSKRKQASLTGSLEIEDLDPSHEEGPQDGDIKYEKNNRLLGNWVNANFRIESTKRSYYDAIITFLRIIYPDETEKIVSKMTMVQLSSFEKKVMIERRKNKIEYFLDKYIADTESIFLDDFKFCILQMTKEEYAPRTILAHVSKIKKFFDRLNPEKYSIENRDMDDIKSGLLPQSITITKDEIPTKDELKTILTYLSIRNKALFLFLISTGIRIGAALRMRMTDINLDLDPPEAMPPVSTTKKMNPPKVWFTSETKEALIAWFKVKDIYLKKSGDYFDKKLVFGINYGTVRQSWNTALKKAGLDQRDPNTKHRIRKFHIHTLRKFFRTQMGDAGMPDMITHALMGHKAYLSDAYDRPRELAKTYAKYMHAVTIFEKDLETEIREKLAKGEADIQDLEKKRQETKMTLSIIAMNLDISNPSELESEALLIQINNAIAKLKKTLASNVEEIAYLKETLGR